MFGKKSFKSRQIWQVDNYRSYTDLFRGFFSIGWIFKIIFIIGCVVLVFYVWWFFLRQAQWAIGIITKWTVKMVSNNVGNDMKRDEFGNVNVMVIWYGGANHAWWYLADSIMVVSWNPKLWAITMISIPRDLYVYDAEQRMHGRINEVFSRGVSRKHEFDTWAIVMASMLEDIVWFEIPYYALVDFQWFQWIIDTLWWIIIDVPERIYDQTYPNGRWWYLTFTVNPWLNKFDGKTALMYARSRHSSSDFARSLRQQQIIKAVMDKISNNGIWNVGKIKQLYSEYTEMVRTNISLKEIIWMVKNFYDVKNIFSYWFTTECSNYAYKYSYPWCFLYTPDRALFDWASVIIPDGWTPGNVTFYDYTKNFAFFVAHNQKYLMENPSISIMNGIDKNFARKTVRKADGFANQLAVKLKKYAFNVVDTQNFGQAISWNVVYVLGTGNYKDTINTLKYFLDISEVVTNIGSWEISYSWVDLMLVLWNQYVEKLAISPFNYYK